MEEPSRTRHSQPGDGHTSRNSNAVPKSYHDQNDALVLAAHRLQASGRMALHAVAGNATMPGVVPAPKTSGGPSASSRPAVMLGETSSQVTAQVGEALRLKQYGQGSPCAFNSFIDGESGQAPVAPAPHASENSPATGPPISFTAQEAIDGAAVVCLLSIAEDAPPTDDDDRLSPAEAGRLREALFGPGKADKDDWDHILESIPTSIPSPDDRQLLLGTQDPAMAQNFWLWKWREVLSSYTDEVWGDLGPLVAEAKQDLERRISRKLPEGSDSCETKAMRRLRLILVHVRQSV